MARDGDVLSGTPDIWERNCAEAISLHGDKLAKVLSGTYTPTLTSVANVDASTAYACFYTRNGSIVTVSGRLDIDATTNGVSTQLGISLPIASNLAAPEDCCGCGAAPGVAGMSVAILGDATNDRAQMQFIANYTLNAGVLFTFSYRVI